MDFIYFGETNIYKDDLDEFLAEAQDLQLKGLAGSQIVRQNYSKDTVEDPIKKAMTIKKEKEFNNEVEPYYLPINDITDINISDPPSEEGSDISWDTSSFQSADPDKVLVYANMYDIKGQINSMLEKTSDGGEIWKCDVCGKSSK